MRAGALSLGQSAGRARVVDQEVQFDFDAGNVDNANDGLVMKRKAVVRDNMRGKSDGPAVQVGLDEVPFFIKNAHASKALDLDGGTTAQIQKDGVARGVDVRAGVDCCHALPSVGGQRQDSAVVVGGASLHKLLAKLLTTGGRVPKVGASVNRT
jgi:hypothetical protein